MANPPDSTNNTRYFTRAQGLTKVITGIFTASVAAAEGAIVYPDPGNAGQWTKADSTAGASFGVLMQTIASTDADYASTKVVNIEVPAEPGVKWFFLVGSGTFTAADVNKYCDLVDEISVAVDTTSKLSILITDYISATRGMCTFAGNVPAGLALPATT